MTQCSTSGPEKRPDIEDRIKKTTRWGCEDNFGTQSESHFQLDRTRSIGLIRVLDIILLHKHLFLFRSGTVTFSMYPAVATR